MGNHAQELKKSEIEGCSFESISLDIEKDKGQKQVTLYKKGDFVLTMRQLYLLSNSKGKKIKIEVKRCDEDKCRQSSQHSVFLLDNKKINAKEVKILYPEISEEISDFSFLKYFFLPISQNIAKMDLLQFSSCKNHLVCSIISYPDIEYNISFGSDFDENEIYLKLSSSYNGGFKKKLDLTREKKSDINADLKKKTEALRKAKIAFELFMKGEEVAQKMAQVRAPIKPKLIKPDISLDLKWNYVVSDDNFNIGRNICLSLKAEPLFGLSVTIDLLQMGLNALTPGLGTLVSFIQDAMKECGNGVEVVCNIVIKGEIQASLPKLEINTSEKSTTTIAPMNVGGKIGAELNAKVSGQVTIWTFEASAQASAKGAGSFTLEGDVSYKEEILGLDLSLDFDGLKVSALWKVEAGLKKKKIGYGQEKEWILIEKKEDVLEWETIELLNFNKK